jgi:FkbM family methyltransferase
MMVGQQAWYAENLPLREQVIADVGAHTGVLSQFFWDASEGSSRVVSIEPLAENVVTIRERIRSAGAAGWTVELCAASSRKGRIDLSVSRTTQGAWNSTVAPRGSRTVPCRPLSTLVPEATVVKLDIEGHEYDVLEEALPKLSRAHAWAVELHRVSSRPLQPVLGAFMAHGYRVFGATRTAGDEARWASVELPASLDWSSIPATRVQRGGAEFKMLHVIALRAP